MKNLIKILAIVVALFFMLMPSTVYAGECKGVKQRVEIRSCTLIPDALERQLCVKEKNLRVARRALETLVLDTGGGATEGGSDDCYASAKSTCNSTLEDVGSIEYDGEICIFTCIAIIPPNPD